MRGRKLKIIALYVLYAVISSIFCTPVSLAATSVPDVSVNIYPAGLCA